MIRPWRYLLGEAGKMVFQSRKCWLMMERKTSYEVQSLLRALWITYDCTKAKDGKLWYRGKSKKTVRPSRSSFTEFYWVKWFLRRFVWRQGVVIKNKFDNSVECIKKGSFRGMLSCGKLKQSGCKIWQLTSCIIQSIRHEMWQSLHCLSATCIWQGQHHKDFFTIQQWLCNHLSKIEIGLRE